MANEKRLIDADDALAAEFAIEEDGAIGYVVDSEVIRRLPTVDAYTAEQVASIIQQADKAEARNQELEKECAWLKSCLNCKIRKECPRHCGKVVHGCDHWEYGDSTVDAVEVVRCKDCMWSRPKDHREPTDTPRELICQCFKHHHIPAPWGARMAVNPDDFCSYGERKDNG